MPRYSRWRQISVWYKSADDILHIRDQILKYDDEECVTFRAKNMRYAIFARDNLEKLRAEKKAKEIALKAENKRLLETMI